MKTEAKWSACGILCNVVLAVRFSLNQMPVLQGIAIQKATNINNSDSKMQWSWLWMKTGRIAWWYRALQIHHTYHHLTFSTEVFWWGPGVCNRWRNGNLFWWIGRRRRRPNSTGRTNSAAKQFLSVSWREIFLAILLCAWYNETKGIV